MKALYYDEPKGYQAIKFGELPAPEISDSEVLVRVKAYSLNHLDVWVMSGAYPLIPPMPHIFARHSPGLRGEGRYPSAVFSFSMIDDATFETCGIPSRRFSIIFCMRRNKRNIYGKNGAPSGPAVNDNITVMLLDDAVYDR